MQSSREAYDNDQCPVREELLGELYRSHEHGLAALVESVPSETRAMLALFCYKRSHLQSVGLAIAATCDEGDLARVGGRLGSVVATLARQAAPTAAPEGRYYNGRKITLSTRPLTPMVPLDEDIEDEAEAEG
jgi:hypothetical protein